MTACIRPYGRICCEKGLQVKNTINVREVIFDERYENDEYGTVTLYFIAPKSYLDWLHPLGTTIPHTAHAEISIECPKDHIEASYARVMIATTIIDRDGFAEDKNWCDVDLPYETIEELIALSEKH